MTKRPEGEEGEAERIDVRSVDQARRRLLRTGAYVVPAVLAVVAVKSAKASTTTGQEGGTQMLPSGGPGP